MYHQIILAFHRRKYIYCFFVPGVGLIRYVCVSAFVSRLTECLSGLMSVNIVVQYKVQIALTFVGYTECLKNFERVNV